MPDFAANRTAIQPGLRTETVAGRRFVVAPAVMAVPGILNGEMVELEELARAARTGNGRPIVVRHPYAQDGTPLSANDLSIPHIGYIYNLAATDRLRGEAWIDVDLANLTEEGREVLRRVQAGEILENSLGWWRDRAPSGQDDFSAYARNIVIDHYAILPDEAGACSVDDGCGIPRVNSRDAGCGCDAAQAPQAPAGNSEQGATLGERIWERLNNLWEFLMQTNNSDRTALVERLAGVASIGLTAEQLGALDDDVLAAFDRASTPPAPVEPVANQDDTTTDDEGNGNAEMETLRAAVAALTTQVEELTAGNNRQREEARRERISALSANAAVDFTAEELEGFSDDQLEVLAGKFRAGRFNGRPAPGSLSVNGNDPAQLIEMPMPEATA